VVPAIALARSATPEATELERPRRSAAVGVAHATRLPDRSFLILAGSALPCVLQTAMDTATPGYVSCVVPSDVYSENGAVVLLEKGTKVLGEYRGGMKQGQTRLFVVWTRAVTPGGVAIDLASPAADALGRAGLDGDLDSHFWSRFGGAILLSVIDGGLGALGRGHAITLQAPATTATTALQGSLDIGPTLRKAPGAPVAIFVAQDLDFSAVYGVRAR
jgi:type IV secretion system protein VirB10